MGFGFSDPATMEVDDLVIEITFVAGFLYGKEETYQ
jgi:hypothetical protein